MPIVPHGATDASSNDVSASLFGLAATVFYPPAGPEVSHLIARIDLSVSGGNVGTLTMTNSGGTQLFNTDVGGAGLTHDAVLFVPPRKFPPGDSVSISLSAVGAFSKLSVQHWTDVNGQTKQIWQENFQDLLQSMYIPLL